MNKNLDQIKKDTRKRFDKKFYINSILNDDLIKFIGDGDSIKSFLDSAIDLSYQQGIRDAIDSLPPKYSEQEIEMFIRPGERIEWNNCLQDSKANISKLLEKN